MLHSHTHKSPLKLELKDESKQHHYALKKSVGTTLTASVDAVPEDCTPAGGTDVTAAAL